VKNACAMESPAADTGERYPHAENRTAVWLASFVYGVIVTLVTIVGLAVEHAPNGLSDAGVIIVGDIAIWMAHAISQLVGHQAQRQQPVGLGDVVRQLGNSWPIVAAAVPAAVVMGAAGAGLWSNETGLKLAAALGVVALAVTGVLSARLSERTLVRQVLYVVGITVVGILIVSLEVWVHHI
jgi:hypothetical protein